MKTYSLKRAMIWINSLLMIESSILWSQQAKNVVLANFISTEALYNLPSSFPYGTAGTDYPLADIWGWTYSGNEYALVCLGSKSSLTPGSGLAIVRVTDPNNIRYIKTIKRSDGSAGQNGPRDVRVFCIPPSSWYAFVSQDNNANYYVNLVTALTDSTNPFAGVTDFIAGSRIHNLHINVNKGLLFLSDFIQGFSIPVYDINNVNTGPPVFKGNIPQLISNASSHDLHASDTRVYDASLRGGTTITNYTYSGGTFNYTAQRRHFYNVKRGIHPSKYIAPDTLQPFTHDAVPSSNELYLYTTTERGGGDTSSTSETRQRGAYLHIWNISSIDAPPNQYGYRYPIKKVYEVKEATQTPSFNDSTFAPLLPGEFSNSIHNVHIRNEGGSDVAYISYYTKGLRILNVANPLSPSELGYYDTPAVTNYINPVYNGPWGVYPYFASGTILGSAPDGLYVLRRATEVSGTVSANTTWSGAIFVTGNITVSSSATLTVSAGTTVAFANGTSLTVNGNLIAVSDDPNKRISFTSNSAPLTSGSWNGLVINSGSSTNTSTLRRCDVQYAVTGITINYTGNTNNVTIDKCKVQNNSSFGINVAGNGSGATVHPTISNSTVANNSNSGIYLTNYAKPTITGNRIENNGYAGIETTSNNSATVTYNYIAGNLDFGARFTFSSSAFFHRNTVKSNYGKGVFCSSTSNLTAYGTDNTQGRNEIILNSGVGIYSSSSSPTFGISPNGHNVIYDNAVYQAQQAGTGQLRAESCWWNGDQGQISGNVDLTPYLTSAPSPPTGWGYSDTYDPTLRIQRGGEDSISVLLPLADISSLMQKSSAPLQIAAMSNDASNWSGDLQAAIDEGLKTGDWTPASDLITNLHRELQDGRAPNVDFTLVTNYANDLTVTASIRKMLALVLMEKDLGEGKVAPALTKLTGFAQNNSAHAAEFLANRGLIYLYRQNDLAAAQNVLSQLQTLAKSGDTDAVEIAESFGRVINNHRRQDSPSIANLEKVAAATQLAPVVPITTALAQNYPNPFWSGATSRFAGNPTTIIRFHLNERQKVRLLIFDLTGKLVQTLLDGELATGEQTILWDGRDGQGRIAASGVYFYELTIGNKVERKKMMLVR